MASASGNDGSHVLWDLPVRAIHWLIVVLLPASWWTAEEGYLDVHEWLGLSLLVLVTTRLVWGVVGSPQARFRDFLRGPGAVLAYLRGAPAATPGHNPAGGWSAVLLWVLLLMQALTGTVNSDDVLFEGPFHFVLDSDITATLAGLHELLFNVMLGFIGLHVLAVLYYERVRGDRLLMPMLAGRAEGRHGTGPARPFYWAIVIAVVLAGVLWGLIELAPDPPPSVYW